MSLLINDKQWQLALVNSDPRKADQLHLITDTTVYHFFDVLSFIDHLKTATGARESLILVISAYFVKDLPPDIREKVHGFIIYDENNQNKFPSFNDVCLHLSGVIIAQCTTQSIHYRHLNENGLARLRTQQSIAQSKNLIEKLQGLCDDIDQNILLGEEAKT